MAFLLSVLFFCSTTHGSSYNTPRWQRTLSPSLDTSANVVFAESYKNPAPAPPVLSSDTNGTPMLGTTAQAMVALWTTCTTPNPPDSSPTCQRVRDVFDFFSLNYR